MARQPPQPPTDETTAPASPKRQWFPMPELALAGFMSYARRDDEHHGGYLTDFRRMLQGELEVQTGETVTIFQDREDILWGQVWHDRLNSGVDNATVLIPIITPSFFTSAECLRELRRFQKHEKELGRDDLIFPLYFIKSPLIEDEERRKDNDLAEVIASRQYKTWDRNRFKPVDSMEIREQIAELAEEIVAAFDRGTALSRGVEVEEDDPWAEGDDDEPGLVERIDRMQTAFPDLVETLDTIVDGVTKVGELTQDANKDIERTQRPGSPNGANVAAFHRFRQKLEPEVRAFESATKEYVDLVGQVDVGLEALFPAAASATGPDAERSEAFLKAFADLQSSVDEGLTSLDDLAAIVEDKINVSSATRPAFRALMVALRRVTSTRATLEAWSQQADAALVQLHEKD